jgi:hypothetical protein
MIQPREHKRRAAGYLWGCLAVAVLLVVIPYSARSAPPERVKPSRAAIVQAEIVVAEGWGLNRFFSFIQSKLGSRARLVQFGAVGMFLGLFIIWWRK